VTRARIGASLAAVLAVVGAAVLGARMIGARAADRDRVEREVDVLAARTRSLSGRWVDVVDDYDRATRGYDRASQKLETARSQYGDASLEATRAITDFERAARQWRFAQALVTAAASMDAGNLDAFREHRIEVSRSADGRISCDTVSTARYRALLTAAGYNLTGIDVDHIVPKSLGGADSADNYQLLPSSVNRSLGATWDPSKCEMAGAQCARAVAVSRACGWFRGPSF
jgi:hypothetical protein